jgi:transposase
MGREGVRMANKRSKYDEAFKKDVAEQVLLGGKSAAEVSESSGVEISVIYGWVRKVRSATKSESVFPGNGNLSSSDDEIRRLRRRVAQLEEERLILKKATVFFARETK